MIAPIERYLADLPAGLDSYPECQVKGSAFRSSLEVLGPEEAEQLPFARGYLESGVLPSAWYSEVHFAVLVLATRARYASEAALLDRIFEANLEMFRSKLYYRLMAFLTPAGLLKRGATNWAQFHRGSHFAVSAIGERDAQATLEFPKHLFTTLHARMFAKAFEAALVFNGAKDAKLDVEGIDATVVRYRASW
ncbi:MAG: hypothetical protein H6721_14785 [Sandaracinus sp.]|nr:hypothetical protein [Myxococcales bacterium]MCB9633378.1 hypothetical protein [Sandaracinus sp.]